nr:hypothetical protein [Tanacetum cinerariifolium]
MMRQNNNLMDINIDDLYNILKKNQGDVNDAMGLKKKTVMVTSDPLALIAENTKVSKRKKKVVVSLDSKGSDADDFSELKKIAALLAKAFNRRKFYSKLTNNNLRTSSISQSANKKQETNGWGSMINSIKNGDQSLPRVNQVSIVGTSSTEQPPLKDKSMWSDQEKSNKTAKDLRDALARHMLESEYGELYTKAVVLCEYKTFKAIEGEFLLDTYIRYLQVINDLKKCGYSKDNCELNFKASLDFCSYQKMSRDVLTVGSTMRISLLYRGEYSQWVERFMNYLEEQTDGEAMINSIKNGDQPLPRVTQVSIAGTSTGQPPLKDKSMCNKTAKDLWDALARHILGSRYGEQDRKAAVLYEYETFKATEGELLLDTYIRYL